jgi:hypothetical protein
MKLSLTLSQSQVKSFLNPTLGTNCLTRKLLKSLLISCKLNVKEVLAQEVVCVLKQRQLSKAVKD